MLRLIGRLGLALTTLAGGVALALLLGLRAFDRLVDRDRQALLDRARPTGSKKVVTETMLADLPAPAARFLRCCGVVGKPIVETVRVHQRGWIRPSTAMDPLPLEADQWYTVEPPGFVWDATVRIAGVPAVRGRDEYLDGRGRMLIKAGGLVPIVDAEGPEMDEASLIRYLSEMPWFPTSFLSDRVAWEAIDDESVRVTLADGSVVASGILRVDSEGRLLEFRAERPRAVHGGFDRSVWSAPTLGYATFEDLELPAHGAATWKLPDGDLEYVDITLTEVEYDPAIPA
jgi:hypothetical protein